MLTASNRLWTEQAANKWFTCTDRKMILKLKNLLGLWFGLMFIEWNIIIIAFLFRSRAVWRIRLSVGCCAFAFSTGPSRFFSICSVPPISSLFVAICASITHSSFTHFRKTKSCWLYFIPHTCCDAGSPSIQTPQLIQKTAHFDTVHLSMCVCVCVRLYSSSAGRVFHAFIFFTWTYHLNIVAHWHTHTINTHVKILWFVYEAVRMLLTPRGGGCSWSGAGHTCWHHAPPPPAKVMPALFACC